MRRKCCRTVARVCESLSGLGPPSGRWPPLQPCPAVAGLRQGAFPEAAQVPGSASGRGEGGGSVWNPPS